ncbi:diguanylate cyclase [Roseomonas frigidaquae]|uniref:Diguanylate cyclase n=1 Tax=Falsiroseomonas frigidaquae TaxID=487318 RepID=A0ABX1EUJ3_9PROT|nr:diguanylate cyclase [Falsiroseomonas frigidaquae]NKE43584.1 diguanylate cyclase [Falsiroseomonas frigidaquae]
MRRVLAAWLVVAVVAAIGTADYIRALRHAAEQAAWTTLEADVAAAQQSVLRAIEAVRSVHSLVGLWRRLSDAHDAVGALAVEQELREITASGRLGVVQVTIADADGWLAWGAAGYATGVLVADREHVRVHLDGTHRGLFISAPVIERTTGRWSIQISQRMEHRNGTLAGVSVVSLDPIVLSQSLGKAGTEPGQAVALRRLSDGAVLAHSHNPERYLRFAVEPDHPGVKAAREARSGRLVYESQPTGHEIMAAYGVPTGLPAVMLALQDRDAGLADPRRTTAAVLAAVSAALLGGLGVAIAWARQANAHALVHAKSLDLAALADQRRAQAELLSAITSSMAQGMAAWDADGRLLACNMRYRQLLDLPEGIAEPSRHYLDLAGFLARRGDYGPGDPDTLARDRYKAATRGDGHRLTRTRSDGSVLEVAGRSLPGGGFVTTFTDVTQAHRAAEALRESEERFRLLAENSGDVVTLSDLDGTRRYVSPAAQRLLGWQTEELVGRNARDFVHTDDRAWLEAALAALEAGEEEATATYRHLRPDGTWLWVEVRCRVHRDRNGGTRGYVATIRDATERKQAETELLQAYEQMSDMAATDALTGIANRRRFDAALEAEWRRCAREEQPLSILMADVDFFKRFNDRYGHPAGDVCLREVAAALNAVARRPGDLPARLGGEEFALLMPATDAHGAHSVAERFRSELLRRAVQHEGNPGVGMVTASIGVATRFPSFEDQLQDRTGLLSTADAALYVAKTAGRNRVVVGSESDALVRT